MTNSFCIFFILLSLKVFCQDLTTTITGKITDAETGEPLTFAHVYIDKTTLVAQTDEAGQYRLENLPLGELDLRVSFIGYMTVKKKLIIDKISIIEISVEMIPGVNLDSVTITGKGNRLRSGILKIISTELIGDNKFRKKCRITNPEVIVNYDDEEGHLRAKASEPLIIENLALGYRIYQELDDFDYFNGFVFFGGSARFEELKAVNESERLKWKMNRKIAYEGSLKHLLTSITSNNTAAEGFRLFKMRDTLSGKIVQTGMSRRPKIADPDENKIEIAPAELVSPGRIANEKHISSHQVLEVFYTKRHEKSPYLDMPYQYSVIKLPQKFIVVTNQGWVVEPRGLMVEGHLSSDRLGTLLPADWKNSD